MSNPGLYLVLWVLVLLLDDRKPPWEKELPKSKEDSDG